MEVLGDNRYSSETEDNPVFAEELEYDGDVSPIEKLGYKALEIDNALYEEREIDKEPAAKGEYPEYYYDWQIECLEEIKDKKHVILSSPTGSGKTTVYLDWAGRKKEEAEQQEGKKHTVYITAPIKALSNQRYEELKKAGYKVGLETGDIKIVPEDADYICCTQEIYTNKYAQNKDATLIVDEFHYIFENQDRSRAYIDGLHDSRAENVLICSATFGDVRASADYVSKVTGEEFYGYTNNERLTELSYEGKIAAEDIHDALVVAFSANVCKAIAEKICEKRRDYDEDGGPDKQHTEKLNALAEELKVDNYSLEQCARYGVAMYYGGMLPKEKAFVERAFSSGLIDVVAGTDALALGVNFPVESVVFAQVHKYSRDTGEYPISKNLFDQLAGRAGRPGFFDKGKVYYCDEFVTENYRGDVFPVWGYEDSKTYSELQNCPNENIKIELGLDYGAILRGEKTPEDEITYIMHYSTESVDVDGLLDSLDELIDIEQFLWRHRSNEDDEYYYDDYDDYETDNGLGGIIDQLEERYGGRNSKQLQKDLMKVLVKCYDERLDIRTNQEYAVRVLSGDASAFEDVATNASSRDLLILHSYLLKLPQKYRGPFALSICSIEEELDRRDETFLGEGAGRISPEEVTECLRENVEYFSLSQTLENIDELLASGVPADKIVAKLDNSSIVENMDELLAAGASADKIVAKLDNSSIVENIDKLLTAGAVPDKIVEKLDEGDIANNLDKLLAAGAKIDADELVSKLDEGNIIRNIDKLQAAGLKIGIDELVSRFNRKIKNTWDLDKLLAAGASADKIVEKLDEGDIIDNLGKLQAAGLKIGIDELVSGFGRKIKNTWELDKLLAAGASADKIVEKLDEGDIVRNIDKLQAAGAKIDVDELVSRLDEGDIVRNIDKLQAAGLKIDIDELVSGFDRKIKNTWDLDKLLAAGASADKIIEKLDEDIIADNIDKLLAAGVPADRIIEKLDDDIIADNLDKLLAAGAKIDVDKLVSRLDEYSITNNLDKLLAAGADEEKIKERLEKDLDEN